MFRLPVATATLLLLTGLASSADPNRSLLEFAQNNLGKRVGGGVCSDLVDGALKATRSRLQRNANTLVFAKEPSRSEGELERVQPGDIVIFWDAILERTERSVAGWSFYKQTALRHAAIIESVDDEKLEILEQNANDQKFVTRNTIRLHDLKTGRIAVYRPVAK